MGFVLVASVLSTFHGCSQGAVWHNSEVIDDASGCRVLPEKERRKQEFRFFVLETCKNEKQAIVQAIMKLLDF